MTAGAMWVHGLRAAWGVVLLTAPRALLRALDQTVDRKAVVVLRVLGARHVGQSVLVACSSRPAVGYLSATVDGVHALTGLGLALVASHWRRGALIDCAVASAFAALTAITTRSARS
jgi:hypothetical protein